MIEITNEKLTKISDLYQEYVGIEDPIELNEETGIYSCYLFTIGPVEAEENVESDDIWISFNEEVVTSTLLTVANFIIPVLEDELETFVHIVKCHAPVFDKNGVFKELIYEDMYEKIVKKLKKPRAETN